MLAGMHSFAKITPYVDNFVLAAATAETITKPAGYASCVITPNADCWIRRGGTAVIPAADVTDGTGSILMPAGTSSLIDLVDTPGATPLASFSIICAGVAAVSVEWFR